MEQEPVYSITEAKTAKTDDVYSREVRYAISMGIRTLCFIGAVVTWRWNVWVGSAFLVGALVLPYTSVVLANAGVRRQGKGQNLLRHVELDKGETRAIGDSAAD